MTRPPREGEGPGIATRGLNDKTAGLQPQHSPIGIVTHQGDVIPDAAAVEALVGLSDERDLWQQLALDMWRDGYRAATTDLEGRILRAYGDGWHAGLAAGAERGTAA